MGAASARRAGRGVTGPAAQGGGGYAEMWAVDVAELARWAPAPNPDAVSRRALDEALEELEAVRGDG